MDAGRWTVLEADGTSRAAWRALFDSWPDLEVFAHPDYLDLYRTASQRPLCFVYERGSAAVVQAVMQRDLPDWATSAAGGSDLASPPFGYGGPSVVGSGDGVDEALLLSGFYARLEEWARAAGVVAEYTLFSPVTGAPPGYPGSLVVRMPTVVRDLDLTPSALWADYKRSVRTEARSAERSGLTVTVDTQGEFADQHLAIHHEILDHRGGGLSGHRLTQEFVTALRAALPGRYVYFHAWEGEEIIASDLCLLSARTALAFRGGTRPDKYRTKATALLTHEGLRWCQNTGRTSFVLGGGISGEDSLFRHKLAFAPRGKRDLQAGRWVIDEQRYDALVDLRRRREVAAGRDASLNSDYFPAYRAP